jgi:hypothetical protein
VNYPAFVNKCLLSAFLLSIFIALVLVSFCEFDATIALMLIVLLLSKVLLLLT